MLLYLIYMALVKQTLETQIKALLQDMASRTDNQEQAMSDLAAQLATIIDSYVKTATVTVTVATTGSATAQAGSGTGTLS